MYKFKYKVCNTYEEHYCPFFRFLIHNIKVFTECSLVEVLPPIKSIQIRRPT